MFTYDTIVYLCNARAQLVHLKNVYIAAKLWRFREVSFTHPPAFWEPRLTVDNNFSQYLVALIVLHLGIDITSINTARGPDVGYLIVGKQEVQLGHVSIYTSVSLRMSCLFTPDAAPLSFESSRECRSAKRIPQCVHACRSTRMCAGWSPRKPKGSHGGHADVGEIPFEKSLERRRAHK